MNELRRRSLEKMINLGEKEPPKYNFDDVNRMVLNELCVEYGLDMFTEEDRYEISWTTPHNFKVWEDFSGVLPKLRERFLCCSFTILSFRIILDTAKRNDLA